MPQYFIQGRAGGWQIPAMAAFAPRDPQLIVSSEGAVGNTNTPQSGFGPGTRDQLVFFTYDP